MFDGIFLPPCYCYFTVGVILTVVRLYCADMDTDYALPQFDQDSFQWDQCHGGSLMYNKQYIFTPDEFVLWGNKDEVDKAIAGKNIRRTGCSFTKALGNNFAPNSESFIMKKEFLNFRETAPWSVML